MHFSLRRGLKAAAQHLPVTADDEALEGAVEFVIRRFEVQLRDEGLRHDAISATIATGLDDPYEIRRIARAFTQLIGTEAWRDILHAHSRCKRIVRDLDETFALNPSVDTDPSSQALHEATEAAWQKMDAAEDKVTTLVEVMANLREPINVFFEAVLVMAKEPELKAARLALVQRIAALPNGIVDLSLFEGF